MVPLLAKLCQGFIFGLLFSQNTPHAVSLPPLSLGVRLASLFLTHCLLLFHLGFLGLAGGLV